MLCLVIWDYVGLCRFERGGKLGVLVVTCVFKITDFRALLGLALGLLFGMSWISFVFFSHP